MNITTLAGIASATLAAAGCGSTSTTSPSAQSESAAPTAGAGGPSTPLTLTAMDFAFRPTSLEVPPNAAVTLTLMNSGRAEHSFTPTSGVTAEVEADGGETKTVSFTAPSGGIITFKCKYHPTKMMGTITVSSAAAAAPPAAAPVATPAPTTNQAPAPTGSGSSGY